MKREIGRTSCVLSIANETLLAGGVAGGITAPGATTANELLVASVTPVAVKRSWKLAPAMLMPRFVKVATPATAVAAVVPVSAAPAAPVPGAMAAVTTVVLSVASS